MSAASAKRACRLRAGDSLTPKTAGAINSPSASTEGKKWSEFHNVRARRCDWAIEACHGLVGDNRRIDHAEAIELSTHCAAVGSEHPDFDIIARPDIGRQLEGSGHAIEIIT